MEPEVKTTSKDILNALEKIYSKRSHQTGSPRIWAFFPELRIGTGFSDGKRRIDAWAICMYPSQMLERVAFEIKVSRADFLNEIKNPIKRREALSLSNSFYFVAPKGLIKREEIPAECGFMEYYEGHFSTTIEAPFRESIRPNWLFVASVCRRILDVENRLIGEGE